MANKTKPKSERYGYELLVNESGNAGANEWRRVGPAESDGIFFSVDAAREYLKRCPNAKKHMIRGVRVSSTLMGLEAGAKFQTLTEKSNVTKGTRTT